MNNKIHHTGTRKLLIAAIAFTTFITSALQAQEELVFSTPEVYPTYPGENAALLQFLSSNFEFPENEPELISTIFFRIDIDTTGCASFDSVLRLTEGANVELFEDELKRIVNLMPKWEAGSQQGVKVPTQMIIPFRVCFR